MRDNEHNLSEAEAAKIIQEELIQATDVMWDRLMHIVGSDQESWLEEKFSGWLKDAMAEFAKNVKG